MAINYITIDSMTALASLAPNDKLLVARADGRETGYATYQCALTTLSSAISCNVSDVVRREWLITALYDSPPDGSDSKAPSYNVLLSVYNVEKYISAHYLNADSTAARNISGNITFTGQSPKVNTVDVTSQNAKLTVNCEMLQTYVGTNVKTRSIGNENPISYIYKVVSKNADENDIYENQSKIGSPITLLRKNCQNGPIIHKCIQDCTVIITAYSVGYKFALFGFQSESAATLKKADIKTDQRNLNWHMLGRLGSYSSSGNTGIMSFQAKAGTWLCFYMNEAWDSDRFKYKPSYTADFGAGDVIRVDEYR